MDGGTDPVSINGRSASPCTSTNDEDASEAFEDARSELEKDPDNSEDQNKYEAVNEIKVASPFRYDSKRRGNHDPLESVVLLKQKRSYSVGGCGSDFSSCPLELPPLETFLDSIKFDGLDLSNGICGSLAGSLENDLLPSTPLTDEQLKYAESVLKDELEGLPINRIEVEPHIQPIGIATIQSYRKCTFFLFFTKLKYNGL